MEEITICSTELHIVRGEVTTAEVGRTLVHEGIGIVEIVGVKMVERDEQGRSENSTKGRIRAIDSLAHDSYTYFPKPACTTNYVGSCRIPKDMLNQHQEYRCFPYHSETLRHRARCPKHRHQEASLVLHWQPGSHRPWQNVDRAHRS
jgi:hypothetical protein